MNKNVCDFASLCIVLTNQVNIYDISAFCDKQTEPLREPPIFTKKQCQMIYFETMDD